jgi:ethanolamine ammonia-lyase small subunit
MKDKRDAPGDLPADPLQQKSEWPEIVRRVRARTPARLLVGRVGASYLSRTQMELREAHAAARDAVRAELDLARSFPRTFVREWKLFEVSSEAASKDEFLLRPDLGRRFSARSRAEILERCSVKNHLQIAIGDGLSVTAVAAQVPRLLRLIFEGAATLGWTTGQTFVIRYCRVGILNEIGELLHPQVAILLIGERPGLATAESLSAYMAYRPRANHTDAERNLVSNIHARGVSPEQAATRILNLAAQMVRNGASGYSLREEIPKIEAT